MRSVFHRSCAALLIAITFQPSLLRGQEASPQDTQTGPSILDLDELRMQLMRSRAMAMRFQADDRKLPKTVNAEPLFRYDDIPRGYLDGAVWRWGESSVKRHPTPSD